MFVSATGASDWVSDHFKSQSKGYFTFVIWGKYGNNLNKKNNNLNITPTSCQWFI